MFPPAVRALQERRVPQILAIYLASCWGLLEFVQFLSERYVLSPHLVDLTLLVAAFMIPSIGLLAWFHGRPGQDEWVRAEKLGVPANVVVTALAAFLVFGGKDLGAATTQVTVQNEDGETVVRDIPKAEFRKRLGLFYLEGEQLAAGDGWLRYAFAHALNTKLAQDPFIDLRIPVMYRDRLREAGFQDLSGIPVTLERQVASQHHREFFADGSVARADDGEVRVHLRLFETDDGSLMEERSFKARDPLLLVDSLSAFLTDALEVPPRGGVPDMPAADLITHDPAAFQSYVEGVVAIHVRDDWQGAGAALQRAVELDPAFAEAQYALAQVNLFSGNTAGAVAPIQAAMNNIYRMPERMQFMVKSDYYFINQQMDRAYSVVDMWVEVFPEDLAAHQVRAQLQLARDDKPAAIASLQTVLGLDAGQMEMLKQIGTLQQASGDIGGARASFERYVAAFPEDHSGRLALGDLSASQGQLDAARAEYEEALALKAGDVATQVKLARVAVQRGEWDTADAELRRAEAAVRGPQDQATVHEARADRYGRQGRMAEALGSTEKALAATAASQPPILAAAASLGEVAAYVRAGDVPGARRIVAAARAQLSPPFDMFVPMGELGLALELEDAAAAAEAADGVERMITALSYEVFRPMLANGRGRVHLLREEWSQAADRFREQVRLDPAAIAAHTWLARALLGMGDAQAAADEVRVVLTRRPADAEARTLLARILAHQGRTAEARAEVERALDIWAPADPGYAPAAEARALYASLGGG